MKRRSIANRRAAALARDRYIYGVHPVTEWLRARPAHVRAVHYDTRSTHRLAPVIELARAAGVVTQPCSDETLSALAGSAHHQGVVAATLPFPYADLDEVVAAQPRLLIVADQMQDPHNLGALLRTAEAVGAGAVIIPKDGAVAVTATVEMAAAGAAALIPVCRVTNIARTLRGLKDCGYWIISLTSRGALGLFDLDVPDRVVVVLGGETGLRPLVAEQCDWAVSIPMLGRTESLNASVAVGIVVYEIRRRWGDWRVEEPKA